MPLMLAAADEGDDLEIVAILDRDLGRASSAARSRGCARPRPWSARAPAPSASSATVSPVAHAAMLAVDPDRKRCRPIHHRVCLCACRRCAPYRSGAMATPPSHLRPQRPQPQPARHARAGDLRLRHARRHRRRLEDRAKALGVDDRHAPVEPRRPSDRLAARGAGARRQGGAAQRRRASPTPRSRCTTRSRRSTCR